MAERPVQECSSCRTRFVEGDPEDLGPNLTIFFCPLCGKDQTYHRALTELEVYELFWQVVHRGFPQDRINYLRILCRDDMKPDSDPH